MKSRACTLRTHRCETCEKRFQTSAELEQHVKTHVVKAFQCDKCEKSFSHKGRLKKHQLNSHIGYDKLVYPRRPATSSGNNSSSARKAGRLRCRWCKKYFTQNHTLQEHMRVHTGEKPFVCRVCHRGFSTSGNMLRHIRTHSGLKPYICKICDRRFTQSSSLVKHTQTNSCMKLFKCPVCGNRSKSLQNFKVHLNEHVDGPFTCNMCKGIFHTIGTFMNHRGKCRSSSSRITDESQQNEVHSPSACTGSQSKHDKLQVEREPVATCQENSVDHAQDEEIKDHDTLPSNILQSLRSLQERCNMDIKPVVCANCKDIFLTAKSLSRHREQCKSKRVLPTDIQPVIEASAKQTNSPHKRIIKKRKRSPVDWSTESNLEKETVEIDLEKESEKDSVREEYLETYEVDNDEELYEMGIVTSIKIVGETYHLDVVLVPEISDKNLSGPSHSDSSSNVDVNIQHWKVIQSSPEIMS